MKHRTNLKILSFVLERFRTFYLHLSKRRHAPFDLTYTNDRQAWYRLILAGGSGLAGETQSFSEIPQRLFKNNTRKSHKMLEVCIVNRLQA